MATFVPLCQHKINNTYISKVIVMISLMLTMSLSLPAVCKRTKPRIFFLFICHLVYFAFFPWLWCKLRRLIRPFWGKDIRKEVQNDMRFRDILTFATKVWTVNYTPIDRLAARCKLGSSKVLFKTQWMHNAFWGTMKQWAYCYTFHLSYNCGSFLYLLIY